MSYALDETIAAISTAPGGAARGMVRLSGPAVIAILEDCFQPLDGVVSASERTPRVIAGNLLWDESGVRLPCELYLWPGTRSYTREPVAELHTLGSPPLLAGVLRRVCQAGARVAQPGEFTLRAFLAGQLDLTQAEAVLGVIDAHSDSQLHAALAQLAGGISAPMLQLREQLLDLLAHLEAGLDFVEEDIEFITAEELDTQLTAAENFVRQIVDQMEQRSETLAELRVVLVGWPNAGKSSLFNSLVGRDEAIVSDIAGTTRDYLVARLVLEGVECELVDTAGVEMLSETLSIAGAAQEMTHEQYQRAQLRLLCLDSTRPLNDWERQQLAVTDEQQLVVLTKADRPRGTDLAQPAIETSSRAGSGLDELRAAIVEAAKQLPDAEGGVVAGTATRCLESLRLAAEALQLARAFVLTGAGEELVAAQVRIALEELGKVVGAIYTDDVLDRIFSRFCIGK